LLGSRIPLIGVCEGVRDRSPDLLAVPKKDKDITEDSFGLYSSGVSESIDDKMNELFKVQPVEVETVRGRAGRGLHFT
jgi:hypothetical protein